MERLWFGASPGPLARWFAADCAARALARDRALWDAPRAAAWSAVRCAWRVAAGRLPFSELEAARLAVEPKGNWVDGRDEARMSAWSACDPDAKSGAWNAAHEARQAASDPGHEYNWQLSHLAYLVRVWAICGERAPWLLLEGKCPIQKEER